MERRRQIITFTDVAATTMMCEDVDTWLSEFAAGTIDGETLTVIDGAGTEIGTLERTSSDEPDLEERADATAFLGTWGTEGEREPYLIIAEGGSVTGSDGCNSLTGSWATTDDRSFEFTGIAMTFMACAGVDQWLDGLASATLDGDTLTIHNTDGTKIGTLPRSA